MVLALTFSRKARTVTETEVKLARSSGVTLRHQIFTKREREQLPRKRTPTQGSVYLLAQYSS